jgi:hypothetical protein
MSVLALIIQRAHRIFSASCYIVICGLSESNFFFTLSHKSKILGGKNY